MDGKCTLFFETSNKLCVIICRGKRLFLKELMVSGFAVSSFAVSTFAVSGLRRFDFIVSRLRSFDFTISELFRCFEFPDYS